MSREEHLEWAKQRALAELDRGSVPNAVASMFSDCSKHDELQGLPPMSWLLTADSPETVRRLIEELR